MLEVDPDLIVKLEEKPNDSENITPVSGPSSEIRDLAFVDFSTPERVGTFLNWAIDRSGLSKAEIARRLGTSRVNFQAYYRSRRGKNIGIKWIVKFLAVVGGKLMVEVPQRAPKPLRKRKV